jgi:hypothetical protein
VKDITEVLTALERIEQRANAATPGPLQVVRGAAYKDAPEIFDHEASMYPPDTTKTHGFQYGGPVAIVQDNGEANDADFFSRANVDIPALARLAKFLVGKIEAEWVEMPPEYKTELTAFLEAARG